MAFRAVNRPDDPQWRTAQGNPASTEMMAGFYNPNKGEKTRNSEGHAIPVIGLSIASGEAFSKGALVRKNGSSEATELTAVTQTIYGVALEDVVAGASLGVRTTRVLVTPVSFTDTERTNKTIKPRFATTDVNGVAPTAAHVGTNCAVSLSGGLWRIDIADTGNEDVTVVDVLITRGEYVVQFIDAVIQS